MSKSIKITTGAKVREKEPENIFFIVIIKNIYEQIQTVQTTISGQ